MKAKLFAAIAVLALAAASCGGGDDGPSGSDRTPAGGGTGTTTAPPGSTPTGTGTQGGGGTTGTIVTAGDNLQFSPPSLSVSRGSTVTWRNTGGLPHTVTFKDNSFDKPLPEGGTVEFTFDKAGTTKYVCKIHPGMEGDVQVT